jgi:hypothetical protein
MVLFATAAALIPLTSTANATPDLGKQPNAASQSPGKDAGGDNQVLLPINLPIAIGSRAVGVLGNLGVVGKPSA